MRIISVKTFVVGNPPPSFGGRYFVFVKLTTSSGVTGLGEVYCVPFHPTIVEQMIAESVDFAFEDMNERIWTEARLKSTELLGAVEEALTQCGDLLTSEEQENIRHSESLVRGVMDAEPHDARAAARIGDLRSDPSDVAGGCDLYFHLQPG